MRIIERENRIRIKGWDWLLIIGLVLAPMTGLRLFKIGPAELLCFIWGLRFLTHRRTDGNFIQRFFILFFSAMFIGTVIGFLFARSELILTDWITWFYLAFVAFTMYEGLSRNELEYNEKLLNAFCFISVIWYLFLYFYSIKIGKVFLGAPLWFSGVRFTGGAKNPHQVAVLMCGVIFCLARNVIRKNKPLWSALFVVLAFYVIFQTASSTAILSVFLGTIVLIMVLSFYRIKSPATRRLVVLFELMLGIVFVVFTYPILIKYFYNWLASDTNGLGRIELFSHIGDSFRKSPIFGLGPGMHSVWGTTPKEFHNSYLEVLACSGILGSVAFIIMSIRSFKRLTADPSFIPVMVAIYGYSLAGFAFRKLAYWGVFIFILIIARQIFMLDQSDEVQDETL